MTGEAERDLLRVMKEWDRAMISNDADVIGRYMTSDWTIVGSDGSVGDKQSFLTLVESGALTHDVMESHEPSIRVYDDVAVVIVRGISGGEYRGSPFLEHERVSCVFVKRAGEWQCVATHLSHLTDPVESDESPREP